MGMESYVWSPIQVWFVVLVFLPRICEAGLNYSTSLKRQNRKSLKRKLQHFISKTFLNAGAMKCVLIFCSRTRAIKKCFKPGVNKEMAISCNCHRTIAKVKPLQKKLNCFWSVNETNSKLLMREFCGINNKPQVRRMMSSRVNPKFIPHTLSWTNLILAKLSPSHWLARWPTVLNIRMAKAVAAFRRIAWSRTQCGQGVASSKRANWRFVKLP